MKIYNYHPETGEYLGESLADESPLEPDVFLIPANATDIAPKEVGENEVAIFVNGTWFVLDDFRGLVYYKEDGSKVEITDIGVAPEDDDDYFGIESPKPSLDKVKALKNYEINAARLSANQTTFSYQGKQVACDPLSRSDIDGINGYVATRGEIPGSWIGGWKATDNSIILIPDVQTWNAFYDSMIAQGQANFAKSESLKAQLALAQTAEEVAAINW